MRAGCGPACQSSSPELQDKHHQMRSDPFLFFRGTFYRWAQLWPKVCPDLQKAPKVIAVGDLHVNSFGTWRDSEGRLAWGVDDFDDAYPLPYTSDLVRLAASGHDGKRRWRSYAWPEGRVRHHSARVSRSAKQRRFSDCTGGARDNSGKASVSVQSNLQKISGRS